MTQNSHHSKIHGALGLAVLTIFMVMFPSAAFAYTLQCANGLPVSGEVFVGSSNCGGFAISNIFSGLNCQFQQILNAIITRMYCGIQFSLGPTLQVVMVIYVLVYALMFMMGLAALTAKELTTRMIKIALIWWFAMNASAGVGLAWYFFSGGIEYTVNLVLQVFYPNMDPRGFFFTLDNIIFVQLTGGLTTLGYGVLGFFATLMILQPPVFLLFLVFMMTVIGALTRALVSYLLGLSAIAFLLALGPIFVSMAFFKATYTFFDSWLKYIISFALQIILIFAAVATWLAVMSLFGNFFLDLARHIVPYEKIHASGPFAFFKNTWGICFSGGQYNSSTGVMSSLCRNATERPMPPSAYSTYTPLISYITRNLISLGIVVYAFDALLRAIPSLAQQLSGPKFAPQLGGGSGFGAVTMPGFTGMGRTKEVMLGRAYQGMFGTMDKIRGDIQGVGGAIADGTAAQNYWGRLSKGNKAKQARDQASRLANN